MAVTEARILEIEGRLTALEQAQNDNTQSLRWLIKTLAEVKVVQDSHTVKFAEIDQRFDGVDKRFDGVDQRFDRVDKRLDGVEAEVREVKADVKGLRKDLPDIVGGAVRDALRKE